jgi:predicted flavoprotein YhiN
VCVTICCVVDVGRYFCEKQSSARVNHTSVKRIRILKVFFLAMRKWTSLKNYGKIVAFPINPSEIFFRGLVKRVGEVLPQVGSKK